MNRRLLVLILIGLAILTLVGFLRASNGAAKFVWDVSNGGQWLLPLLLVAALIDSVNPCAFSILLLTIAFLFSLGRMRSDILKIGGFYIAGLFAVYILIGLGILNVLHLFNTPHFMARVGAAVLVAWGLLSVINHLFPKFPIRLGIPCAAHAKMAELMQKASLPTAFFLGGLVGLCEFPCTGGPYLMVLGLLHDQQTYVRGLGYLVLYNLIFILPLAVILLIASNQALLSKVEQWKKQETGKMRLWGSLAMVALGLVIFWF